MNLSTCVDRMTNTKTDFYPSDVTCLALSSIYGMLVRTAFMLKPQEDRNVGDIGNIHTYRQTKKYCRNSTVKTSLWLFFGPGLEVFKIPSVFCVCFANKCFKKKKEASVVLNFCCVSLLLYFKRRPHRLVRKYQTTEEKKFPEKLVAGT